MRAAVEQAQVLQRERGRQTVLFLDEVHRFNKSQQDAFLPCVEDGTVCFIGATTENPSFEINSALLSRARMCSARCSMRRRAMRCASSPRHSRLWRVRPTATRDAR